MKSRVDAHTNQSRIDRDGTTFLVRDLDAVREQVLAGCCCSVVTNAAAMRSRWASLGCATGENMKIDKIVPTLRVKDARKSVQFYCDVLGFTKEWEHQFSPEFPLLMSISFTGCSLFLTEHTVTGSDNCDIYLYVDDVDGFYEEKCRQGLAFVKAPVDEPWGMREVAFTDPDNHRFTIGASVN